MYTREYACLHPHLRKYAYPNTRTHEYVYLCVCVCTYVSAYAAVNLEGDDCRRFSADLVAMWSTVQAVDGPYHGIRAQPRVQGMSRACPVPTLCLCCICARYPAPTSALLGVVRLAMELDSLAGLCVGAVTGKLHPRHSLSAEPPSATAYRSSEF